MLTSDHSIENMDEDTRSSYFKAREQGKRKEEEQKRKHDDLIASGRAINVVDAMSRCFTSGNSGVEKLKGY